MTNFSIILLLVGGVLLLYAGAELLVHYANKLAISFGMTSLMAGLTIVAFCTSAPELVSSLVAQVSEGNSNMALGNIIGSNVANIGLILGAVALIKPIEIERNIRVFEAPLGILLVAALWVLMLFEKIGRGIGVALIILLALYIGKHVLEARKNKKVIEGSDEHLSGSKKIACLFLLTLGALIVVSGGYVFIKGAVALAEKFNISGRLVGLTIVAVGSSLPEFAASFVALYREKLNLAVGNIFGSNILNILFVLGVVSLVSPISFSSKFLVQDMPFMLGFALLAWLLSFFTQRLNRISGIILLLGYGFYIYIIA